MSVRSANLRPGEFWALKNISFDLYQGQSMGVVGANGSGKTTLLKIICGMLKPTDGSVAVSGRAIPLFAKGAGFNKILTGRENMYLNMSLLGLSEEEIEICYPNAVDFAELDPEALGAPLKTYSSGMTARLGFACGVFAKPDILLVDEILAVGDIKFRAKCYQRLERLKDEGVSLLMVTHSMAMINRNTDNSIFLKEGVLRMFGESKEVSKVYEEDMLFSDGKDMEAVKYEASFPMFLFDQKGKPAPIVRTGTDLKIVADVSSLTQEEWVFHLEVEDRLRTWGVVMEMEHLVDIRKLQEGRLEIFLPKLRLSTGRYLVRLSAKKTSVKEEKFTHVTVVELKVKPYGSDPMVLYYQPNEFNILAPTETSAQGGANPL